MSALALPAPAKLNLFLHVLGRREDGYHRLETVFQLLDVGDEIELEVTAGPGIRRDGAIPGVAPETDLALRAARLLAEHAGVRRGARIAVRKRLPLGGGVGGGSSDAATVLVGLNRLWGLDLPPAELAALGLALGADVPVFVHGRSAFAGGVGEALAPLRLAPSWYLVACPAVAVSTAAVFADPSLTRDTEPLKIEGFPWALETEEGLERLLERTRNDCAPVVLAREPAVVAAAAVLADVAGDGARVRLTGTGACLFLRYREARAAESALAQVPDGLPGFVARGVDRSPLVTALGP